MLDNANIELGAARLTAFRNRSDWLIVFEIVGFSVPQVEFVNGLYAYGSCVYPGGFAGEEIPFASASGSPIFDPETNECVANWKSWAILIDDRVIHFNPTLEEYALAGIQIKDNQGQGTITEGGLLRYVVFRFREELFLKDEALLAHFPKCQALPKFIQTMQWQHPDLAHGEKPSENIAIRSLIHALANNDACLFDPGKPNTHWRFWAERMQ